MINLDDDLCFPNTQVIRDLLESLNYKLNPLSGREHREIIKYKSICFSEWLTQFDQIRQTNKMYYCMNKPNLTEDQAIFVFNILHVCPDYLTFKEALEQYINSNPYEIAKKIAQHGAIIESAISVQEQSQ